MTALDQEIDRRIRSTSKWYWNKYYRDNSTLQYEDALQHCRLRFLEKPVAHPHLVWKRVCWDLSHRFVGNHDQRYEKSFEYKERLDLGILQNITDQQREHLYENIWAVGHPNSYATLRRYLEGETTKIGGLSTTLLTRGRQYLARAFLSVDHLLGTQPARWLPRYGFAALKRFKKGDFNGFDQDQKAFLARQVGGPYWPNS